MGVPRKLHKVDKQLIDSEFPGQYDKCGAGRYFCEMVEQVVKEAYKSQSHAKTEKIIAPLEFSWSTLMVIIGGKNVRLTEVSKEDSEEKVRRGPVSQNGFWYNNETTIDKRRIEALGCVAKIISPNRILLPWGSEQTEIIFEVTGIIAKLGVRPDATGALSSGCVVRMGVKTAAAWSWVLTHVPC